MSLLGYLQQILKIKKQIMELSLRVFCVEAFFIVALCLCLCTACSRSGTNDKLVIGMDLSYPPFETIGPDGSPAGISVELAGHLGAYLHRSIHIENIPFVHLIHALRTKKVDLVISFMTDTPKRRKSIAFSDPYLTIGLACLARKGLGVREVQEFNAPTYKVAVRQGTTAQIWARKNLPRATLLAFEKESEAVCEIIRGKADAFLYDQMSVWRYWQLHRDRCVAILHPLTCEQWAIGTRLCDTVLLGQVNAFLKDFRKQGGFAQLSEEYLSHHKKAFRRLGIPFPFYF